MFVDEIDLRTPSAAQGHSRDVQPVRLDERDRIGRIPWLQLGWQRHHLVPGWRTAAQRHDPNVRPGHGSRQGVVGSGREDSGVAVYTEQECGRFGHAGK